MAPLRVVQWATGNIGTRSLRGVIEHPRLELAGVWVHTPEKVGLDAGELCGLGPTGITASGDRDEVVALAPDCVLYMPRALDVDEVCQLLESGANVVTTRGELHHPPSMDDALRQRIESACAAGGASIHSTGSSPGFITEAVPLALTSIQRRLDSLLIEEFADLSQRDSPDLLFEIMGFGKSPGALGEGRVDHLRASFGPSLCLLAETLGLAVDDVAATGDVAVAPEPLDIAAGRIDRGTVAAQRVEVTVTAGPVRLRFRASWYCGTELDPHWDLRPTGWRITVDGDAPLRVDLPFPVSVEQLADITPGYTANRAVNAVDAVCAAEPGIRTVAELPNVVAHLGR